jgi:hypothetical protein
MQENRVGQRQTIKKSLTYELKLDLLKFCEQKALLKKFLHLHVIRNALPWALKVSLPRTFQKVSSFWVSRENFYLKKFKIFHQIKYI